MGNDELHAAIEQRRRRLGLDKKELAEEADVSRATLGKIEAGKPYRQESVDRILAALARLEHETGMDAPPAGPSIVTMTVESHGVRFAVSGPVGDREELEASVLRLAQQIAGATAAQAAEIETSTGE